MFLFQKLLFLKLRRINKAKYIYSVNSLTTELKKNRDKKKIPKIIAKIKFNIDNLPPCPSYGSILTLFRNPSRSENSFSKISEAVSTSWLNRKTPI